MKKAKKVILGAMMTILAPTLANAKDLESMIKTITGALDSTIVKAIGTLIIIAVGIYMVKNHDRIKEVATMCITIIVGVVIIMNASSIAEILF